MGELVASRSPDDVLVTIGLGSCIGLALLDRTRRIAGLAHVVLPEALPGGEMTPGKFGDLAVGALSDELVRLGASRARLQAVIVGGAQMFNFGKSASGMDVGSRNEASVRDSLNKHRIPLLESDTAGSKGRTVRVHVGTGAVTSKVAGGESIDLVRAA